MAGSPSNDLYTILSDDGVPGNWTMVIANERPDPDRMITLYDTGGAGEPDPKWLLEQPTVQVRVRGTPGDYLDTYNKCQQIRDALLGRSNVVVSGTKYVGFYAQSDIIRLPYDNNNRPIVVINLRMWREPDSGTHRQDISNP